MRKLCSFVNDLNEKSQMNLVRVRRLEVSRQIRVYTVLALICAAMPLPFVHTTIYKRTLLR